MTIHSDLTLQPAVSQAALLAGRKISPVELLDAHLAQIARLNPELNAIVTLAEDQARTAAREAEAAIMRGEPGGALRGLPVVIKDVTETAGIRTTYGCPLYRDNIPDRDADVVTRLRAAGGDHSGQDQHARICDRRQHGQ